jgi:hypothetical protein
MQIVEAVLFLFFPPYVLAVIMPSWRWLLVYSVCAGGLLAAWYSEIATSRYGESAIGLLFLMPVAVSFAAGVLIRTASLIMAARGYSRSSVLTTNVLGFAIPIAMLGASAGWAAWVSRPPSEACSSATFDVELARGRLAIPAAPIVSIFLESQQGQNEYNFAIPPKLRDFCAVTGNGTHAVPASRVWFRLGLAPAMTTMADPKFCASPPAWATALCPEIAQAKRSRTYESALPYSVSVTSSDAMKAESGGVASTYEYSLTAPATTGATIFVRSVSHTPDGQPLTFVCRASNDQKHLCKTSYPWRDGIQLTYEFKTDAANLGEKGEYVDAMLHGFLEQILVKDEK